MQGIFSLPLQDLFCSTLDCKEEHQFWSRNTFSDWNTLVRRILLELVAGVCKIGTYEIMGELFFRQACSKK
jgi:hypothetical protein